MIVQSAFKCLWASACQNKHKVFFWLLLQHKLSTRNFLKRRNMVLPSYHYVCCNPNVEESLVHLFLECIFAHACWATIQLHVWSFDPLHSLGTFQESIGCIFLHGNHHSIMCWCIWMQCNDFIFKGFQASSNNCLAHLVILRAKARNKLAMSEWLEALCNLFVFFISFFVF